MNNKTIDQSLNIVSHETISLKALARDLANAFDGDNTVQVSIPYAVANGIELEKLFDATIRAAMDKGIRSGYVLKSFEKKQTGLYSHWKVPFTALDLNDGSGQGIKKAFNNAKRALDGVGLPYPTESLDAWLKRAIALEKANAPAPAAKEPAPAAKEPAPAAKEPAPAANAPAPAAKEPAPAAKEPAPAAKEPAPENSGRPNITPRQLSRDCWQYADKVLETLDKDPRFTPAMELALFTLLESRIKGISLQELIKAA